MTDKETPDAPLKQCCASPYPNLKKGLKWGFIWGSGTSFLVFVALCSVPRSPDLVTRQMPSRKTVILDALAAALWVFIIAFLVSAILAAFRPEMRKNRKD